MDKKLVFLLGVLTGGAAGSVASYFLTRNHIIDQTNDILDQYAEDCKKKIQEIEGYYENALGEVDGLDGDDSDSSNQGLDPEVANNDGVKKYHHYSGGFGEDSAQKVFANMGKSEEDEKVTEGEKALVADKTLDDVFGIDEITEDDFLNDEEYDPVTLDYNYNLDKLYWGYGTDNEIEAEAHYGKSREELIGKIWRWAPDYIKDPDEQAGAAYVRNSNLGIIFEVIVHYDPSQPVAEVSLKED